MLVMWFAVPFITFEVYPLKGYQYLLPIAPAMALLAARGLATWVCLRAMVSSLPRLGSDPSPSSSFSLPHAGTMGGSVPIGQRGHVVGG